MAFAVQEKGSMLHVVLKSMRLLLSNIASQNIAQRVALFKWIMS